MCRASRASFDLDYNGAAGRRAITYGDVFKRAEREFSAYNFEVPTPRLLTRHFADAEGECGSIARRGLALPAYDQCLKASHLFNLLGRPRRRSASPSAPPISAGCAPWPAPAAKPGSPGRKPSTMHPPNRSSLAGARPERRVSRNSYSEGTPSRSPGFAAARDNPG